MYTNKVWRTEVYTYVHAYMFVWVAAAAESLQSCPTLCDPIDSSPPGSPVPGTLQARTLEWVRDVHLPVWMGMLWINVIWWLRWLPIMQVDPGSIPGSEDPLEKDMATHSNSLAWKIPWTEEPGRLQSMGLQRAGHDWATSCMHACLCVSLYVCIYVFAYL